MEKYYYAGGKYKGCAKIVRVKKNFFVLSSLMLLVVANSMAMSLGLHRGATLIGRPLDISVQAVLDAQGDIANLCIEADVFYADNKLDKSRVRVTAERISTGSQDAVIRVRSSSLVDEPVVTLYLRVGCQQKTERRYVTLADLASDVLPDRSALAQMAVPASSALALPALAASPASAAPEPVSRPVSASDQAQTVLKKSKTSKKMLDVAANTGNLEPPPVLKPDRAASNKPNAAMRARLKLEPLDLSFDRDPQLKPSAELLTLPTISPEERAAAAALWQALNAQPQDILRDTQKLQMLEKSVLGLQAQSQKTQLAIDELGVKLQKAQSERYANALVYTLAALLLLALAGAAYLIRERFLRHPSPGRDLPWWRKKDRFESASQLWANSTPTDHMHDLDHLEKANYKSVRDHLKPLPPDIDLSAGLSTAEEKAKAKADFLSSQQRSDFNSDSVPPRASRYRSDFAISVMPHQARAVKAEELFDVQQQADFFVSIGQHDQAIDVLRSHIDEGVETSALVYLDLFHLYHQLKREKDYSALREEFNHQFNTEIPVFDMYTDVAPGLDAYQLAMSRIEALWPSPKVLEIIEESLFRKPNKHSEAFNLVAYRELLLLYSVAKEIISPEPKAASSSRKFDLPGTTEHSPGSRPMTFAHTSIQPLSASMNQKRDVHPDALMDPLSISIVPPASLNLGLDLDLSQPLERQDKTASMAESDADFFAKLAQLASMDALAMELPQTPADAPAKKTLPKPESDNLIDFDAFDSSIDDAGKMTPPKS